MAGRAVSPLTAGRRLAMVAVCKDRRARSDAPHRFCIKMHKLLNISHFRGVQRVQTDGGTPQISGGKGQLPGGKRPVAREPGNCAGESLRAPGERDNCPGERAKCAGERDNCAAEMERCPVEKAVFRGTRPGAEGKIPADARADTMVAAQRIAAADDGQMLLSLHFCFFNKSHFQNCGETAQPNRFPAGQT
jgi:hypothetical protein